MGPETQVNISSVWKVETASESEKKSSKSTNVVSKSLDMKAVLLLK